MMCVYYFEGIWYVFYTHLYCTLYIYHLHLYTYVIDAWRIEIPEDFSLTPR